MSAVADAPSQVPRLDVELTTGCDHRCGHCYNVWGAEAGEPQGGYPRGQLSTPDTLAMLEKAVGESGAQHLTLTGGEPLLRKDALTVVERACQLVPSVLIITNGSHVPPETARRLGELGVRGVQVTLLSADRERHDRRKGAACFDATIRAILDLQEAGVPPQVCFVATRETAPDLEGVLELAFALDVRALSYNRMSAAGASARASELVPTAAQIEANLDTLDRLGRAWGIKVSTAMPIPPCLVRLERYTWVRFGFCSVGSRSPNVVVDPLGNVRSCNLSSHVLGNIRRQSWADIMASPYLEGFPRIVPPMCRGCRYERSCQGGCKESGFAAFGDLAAAEPLLRAGLAP